MRRYERSTGDLQVFGLKGRKNGAATEVMRALHRAGLGRKVKTSFFNILYLRYLLDI